MDTMILKLGAAAGMIGGMALIATMLYRSVARQQTGRMMERRLRCYDEAEAPARPSGVTRTFEVLDAAFKLAFGLLCLELVVYMGYLYFSGKEGHPLVSLMKPVFQNAWTLPGMLLITAGGIMGFRK